MIKNELRTIKDLKYRQQLLKMNQFKNSRFTSKTTEFCSNFEHEKIEIVFLLKNTFFEKKFFTPMKKKDFLVFVKNMFRTI